MTTNIYLRMIEKTAAGQARFIVSAPIGAFQNHIRWLLSVNSAIEHTFILNNVYPSSRNAFNWLMYEWWHRTKQQVFALYHTPNHIIEDKPDIEKIGFFFMEPELCLRHYLKINPTLNGLSVPAFLEHIQHTINMQCEVQAATSVPTVSYDVGILRQKTLDPEFYQSLVSFFELPNNYELANDIHGRWYILNELAEESMKTLPSSVEDFPWKHNQAVNPKLTNQADYDKLLVLLREIYQ